MSRFLLKRILLALVTLVLLSMIVFAASQLLPGNLGRNVLGNLASQRDVDAFNHAARRRPPDRRAVLATGSATSCTATSGQSLAVPGLRSAACSGPRC